MNYYPLAVAEFHVEEALLRQRNVANLDQPKDRVLNAYRHWFKVPRPALLGHSKKFLDDADDLVALKSAPESDYLSLFLRRHWPAQVRKTRELCSVYFVQYRREFR
jgi:hypothetical protein